MPETTRELRIDARCPCNSGLRYGACCKGKKIRWLRNRSGKIFREVPLNEGALQALETATEQFHRLFERPPGQQDPIMLAKYLYSSEDLERESVELLERAGMPPQFIHAYKRTGGLLLSEGCEDFCTTQDLADWNEAIDEYFFLEENPPTISEYDQDWSQIQYELESCIILMGYVLEHGCDNDALQPPSSSQHFTIDSYAIACATKSIKTLRAVRLLLKEQIGADCLPLARHIYENYLHIVFAKNAPNMLHKLTDIPAGLRNGTHMFMQKKNGQSDNRWVVRKADGAILSAGVSSYRMAESSGRKSDLDVFTHLYPFLSDYTHPSLASLHVVLDDSGNLTPLANELSDEAQLLSISFAAMVLSELIDLASVNRQAKADLGTVSKRAARKIVDFIDRYGASNANPDYFSALRSRLSELCN